MASRGNSLFRLLLLAGTASVLGVGAWIMLGGGVSPTQLTGALERSVQRATGRAFTIDWPLRVSMGLSPTITATGIRFANVAGGSRPDMLTARALHAQVALLPLLQGQVVIENVTLEDPDILLESGPDGTPNWQFHAARPSLFRGGDEPAGPRGGGQALDFRDLRIEGGQITLNTASLPSLHAALTKARIHAETGAAPLRGNIEGMAGTVPFTVSLSAGSFERLQGGPATALAGAWPLTIKADAAGATLKLEGGINHPDEMRGYTLLLTGNVPDAAPFMGLLPKALALPLRDVNLTMRLGDGANGEFRTTGLSVHAGGADLSAAVPGLVLLAK